MYSNILVRIQPSSTKDTEEEANCPGMPQVKHHQYGS